MALSHDCHMTGQSLVIVDWVIVITTMKTLLYVQLKN